MTSTVTTVPEQTELRLRTINPTELAAHPLNLRENDNVADILPSIREMGVLEPPLIVPDGEDRWVIVAGHRRIAAAIEAGLTEVACVERPDLAADTEALFTMLVENGARQGLTTVEEARGYQQLLDLGLSATKIAKRTGRKRADVNQSVAVLGNQAATDASDAGLNVLQALTIAEFEDDPDAVEVLYEAAANGEGAFNHAAARLRDEREDAAKRAETEQAIADAGVRLLTDETRDEWPNAMRLSSLVTPKDREHITSDDHTDCPGHAAAADTYRPETTVYYCVDPDAYGHESLYNNNRRRSGPMTDEEKAERKNVVKNNKAWKAAETVRHDWVRDLLARKKAPKGLLRWAVAEVGREAPHMGKASDGLIADLLRADADGGSYSRRVIAAKADEAPEAALPLVLFAQLAADREHRMNAESTAGRMCWRGPSDTEARYLAQLREMGYKLAEVETMCVEHVFPTQPHTPGETDASDDDGQASANKPTAPVLTVVPPPEAESVSDESDSDEPA